MHYFKRNIGDYHKKAGRLNMLQHGAYTLLIDACYDRERFPTRDEAIDWCWAVSNDEISAVEFVLSKFFELHNGVYKQSRIAEEIEQYHATALVNARIAQEREAKKRADKARIVHGASTVEHESAPNHKPLTINQEPINIQDTARAKAVAVISKKPKFDLMESVPDLCQQVAEDFIAVRKSKKSPMTATALALITKEADKAGITTAQAIAIAAGRGWQSFKAEWISQDKTFAEKEQDYKDEQAKKHYRTLLTMTDDEKKAWGFQ
jgi:uncharacterized protein YdaU (DUF1376 family)